jgi:hypothetical protein
MTIQQKRNLNWSNKCSFYDSEEIVNNLFISCPFARLVWTIVYATFDIPPSTNITNMFGNWLNGIYKKTEARIRIGVSALCLSIWKCWNNVIFNRKDFTNFYIGYSYGCPLDSTIPLPFPEGSAGMVSGCNRLLMVARDTFCRAG